MSNVNEAPRNVQDAIFYNLQHALKQYGGKLNPDSHQNTNVLLRWASEEYFDKKSFSENAAPEVIGNVLLARVKASPKSLVWDTEPDFTPAAPEFTIADVNKQADEFAAREAKRILREKLDNEPKKFEASRKKIEADKKRAAWKLTAIGNINAKVVFDVWFRKWLIGISTIRAKIDRVGSN